MENCKLAPFEKMDSGGLCAAIQWSWFKLDQHLPFHLFWHPLGYNLK